MLRFDLGSSRERDEWIPMRVLSIATPLKLGRDDLRQRHGEETATSAREGMSYIVAMLND